MSDLDSYLDPALVVAKRNPFGERRFFPPGEHPATRRYRDQIAALSELRDRLVRLGQPTTACDEVLDHCQGIVASFEEDESIAKADYLRRLRRP